MRSPYFTKLPPPLCAAVGFGDGITSANVVGYASNNLRYGSIGLVPQFLGIGSADGSINLQDIKCGEGCSDSVSVKRLNNIGIGGDSYFWVDWYGETGDEKCWVDGAYEKVTDFTVDPGQGLWVDASNDSQYIIFPGVEL